VSDDAATARQNWKEAERQRLMDLKVVDLKQLCRGEGLAVGGSKAELVERLLEAKNVVAAQVGRSEAQAEERERSETPAVMATPVREAVTQKLMRAVEEPGDRREDVGRYGRRRRQVQEEEQEEEQEQEEEIQVMSSPAPTAPEAAAAAAAVSSSAAQQVVGDVMSLMGLKVVELRDLCRENGLPVSGEKRVLIERLVDHRMRHMGGQE
jgi:pyruvate/2-oxoglutarate dehydrogenase complex dihydrolipoamide acyltransferase (E2) component